MRNCEASHASFSYVFLDIPDRSCYMPFCYVLKLCCLGGSAICLAVPVLPMAVFTRRMNLRWSTLTLGLTGIDLGTPVIVCKR
jgi:hypothetical protein